MEQQNKNNINIRYIYTISPNNNENIHKNSTLSENMFKIEDDSLDEQSESYEELKNIVANEFNIVPPINIISTEQCKKYNWKKQISNITSYLPKLLKSKDTSFNDESQVSEVDEVVLNNAELVPNKKRNYLKIIPKRITIKISKIVKKYMKNNN